MSPVTQIRSPGEAAATAWLRPEPSTCFEQLSCAGVAAPGGPPVEAGLASSPDEPAVPVGELDVPDDKDGDGLTDDLADGRSAELDGVAVDRAEEPLERLVWVHVASAPHKLIGPGALDEVLGPDGGAALGVGVGEAAEERPMFPLTQITSLAPALASASRRPASSVTCFVQLTCASAEPAGPDGTAAVLAAVCVAPVVAVPVVDGLDRPLGPIPGAALDERLVDGPLSVSLSADEDLFLDEAPLFLDEPPPFFFPPES